MSARNLDTATKAVVNTKPILPMAFIIRLDILGDPLLCWSGIGPLVFAGGATGDTALDGNTFDGLGTILSVGTINDSIGGSDALQIDLPGVNLTDPALRQLIYNRNRWQFRRAWVWGVILDQDTGAVVGKPFRLKTGRMDQMPFKDGDGDNGGVVSVTIEGQQAYGSEPLNTRYSEAVLLDSADISQRYVISLANMTAAIGTRSSPAGSLAAVPATSGGIGAAALRNSLNQKSK